MSEPGVDWHIEQIQRMLGEIDKLTLSSTSRLPNSIREIISFDTNEIEIKLFTIIRILKRREMILLSDKIQAFIDWLEDNTDFGDWGDRVKFEVHKKLIECMTKEDSMPTYLGKAVSDDYLQGLIGAYRDGYKTIIADYEDSDQPIIDRLAANAVITVNAANALGVADAKEKAGA